MPFSPTNAASKPQTTMIAWAGTGITSASASDAKYVFTPNQPNCRTPIRKPGMKKPPLAPNVEVPTM